MDIPEGIRMQLVVLMNSKVRVQMENKMEKLIQALECFRDELHAPGITQNDVQTIITTAKNRIQACAEEVEQAQKTISLTDEQLKTVVSAREAAEAKVAAAISEENDAAAARDVARKILEGTSSVNTLANPDAAGILQKAAAVLQGTVDSSEKLYAEKAAKRQSYEAELDRISTTEKSINFASARAYTTEAIRLKEKITAEKAAEIQEAEVGVINCQKEIDALLAERAAADLDNRMAQHNADLSAAEKLIADNSAAERDEQVIAQAKIDEEKAKCAETVASFREIIDAREAEKKEKDDALILERSEYLAKQEEKARIAGEEALVSAEKEKYAAEKEVQREEKFHALEEGLASIRRVIEEKELANNDANEKWQGAKLHLAGLTDKISDLEQQIKEAADAEQVAVDAAEVSKKLAEDAQSVLDSIGSESANLLLPAQAVLVESAQAAEKLIKQKHQIRLSIEKQRDETSAEADKAAEEENAARMMAEAASCDLKEHQDKLADETAAAEREKIEFDRDAEAKLAEYQTDLERIRSDVARIDNEYSMSAEKVVNLESAIAGLGGELQDNYDKIAAAEAESDRVCAEFEQQRDEKLAEVREAITAASAEVEQQRRNIAAVQQEMDQLGSREYDLRSKLDGLNRDVTALIGAAAEQINAADAEVERRRALEDDHRVCAEGIAAVGSEEAAAEIAPLAAAAVVNTEAEDIQPVEEASPVDVVEMKCLDEEIADAAVVDKIEVAEPVADVAETDIVEDQQPAAEEDLAEGSVITEAAQLSVEDIRAAAQQPAQTPEEFATEAAALLNEEDEEKARIRAKEEAEEAEIMKGLTGTIPALINKDDAAGSDDYNAWLNMIDNDMLDNAINGNAVDSGDNSGKVEDWMADLSKQIEDKEPAEEPEKPADAPKAEEAEKPKKKRLFGLF